jgi:hypothetical protein
MSTSIVGDSATVREAREKVMTPMLNSRSRPTKSAMAPPGARRAAISTAYAVTTQETVVTLVVKSDASEGMARLVTVASRVAMNEPPHAKASRPGRGADLGMVPSFVGESA